nr:type II toxin-antitoxin system RelE/ParE family toxin [Pseudomonas palleroniana]
MSGFEKALKNLEDEANYIALENPKAADDFSDAIFASPTNWLSFPPWDAKVGIKHTREWAVPN